MLGLPVHRRPDQSAIIVAVTLPLIPLFMALVGWYTDRQTRAKWAGLSRLAGHFTDVVAGLPTLKVFGRAKAQAAAVRAGHRRLPARRPWSPCGWRSCPSMVLELLASLSVALVAVAIGLRLVYGDLTLEIGLAVLILAPEAYLPLRQLGTQFHAAADGVAATAQSARRPRHAAAGPPAPARDLAASAGIRLDAADGRQRRGAGRGRPAVPRRRRPAGSPSSPGTAAPARPRCCSCSPGCSGRTPAVLVAGPERGAVPRSPTWIQRRGGRGQLAWAGQGAAMQAGTIRDNLAAGPATDEATLRSALRCRPTPAGLRRWPARWAGTPAR